jgi:acyl carrier protein
MAYMSAVAPLTDPNDDDAVIAWILALIEAAPDIYLRPLDQAPSKATRLEADLGIDSIGKIGLFYEIADALDGETNADDEAAVAEWRCLGDIITFIRRSIRATAPIG